jgi:translation elongation factor EF-1beta
MNNLKINQYLNNNNIILEDHYENDILWESDEEKEKLAFYLNYLSIYVLYLHDRNSIKKIKDNLNKENNINIIEYDFKNLYSKIKRLLEDNPMEMTQNFKNQNEVFALDMHLSSNNMKNNINKTKTYNPKKKKTIKEKKN